MWTHAVGEEVNDHKGRRVSHLQTKAVKGEGVGKQVYMYERSLRRKCSAMGAVLDSVLELLSSVVALTRKSLKY